MLQEQEVELQGQSDCCRATPLRLGALCITAAQPGPVVQTRSSVQTDVRPRGRRFLPRGRPQQYRPSAPKARLPMVTRHHHLKEYGHPRGARAGPGSVCEGPPAHGLHRSISPMRAALHTCPLTCGGANGTCIFFSLSFSKHGKQVLEQDNTCARQTPHDSKSSSAVPLEHSK